MLFADAPVDWTKVIETVGVTVTVVVGALGGWYLKILTARQAHEMEQAKLRAEGERAAREEAARREAAAEARRLAELERLEERERKAEAAEAKRENNVVAELRRLVERYEAQHAEDRETIHTTRQQVSVLSNRLEFCEAMREAFVQQFRLVFDRLNIDLPPEYQPEAIAARLKAEATARPGGGSKPHRPLPPEGDRA